MSNWAMKSKVLFTLGVSTAASVLMGVYCVTRAAGEGSSLLLIALFAAVAVLSAIVAGAALASDLSEGARRAAEAAKRVASGDISPKTGVSYGEPRRDEFGEIEAELAKAAAALNGFMAEIKASAAASAKGKAPEPSAAGLEGGYKEAHAALNAALKDAHGCIADLAACVSGFASGDFDAGRGMQFGKMDEPKRAADAAREAFNAMAAETQKASSAVAGGDFAARLAAAKFPGGWAAIPKAVNGVTESLTAPIGEFARVADRAAGGDLSARVSENYRGGHQELKEALNKAVAAFAQYTADMSAAIDRMPNDGSNARVSGGYAGDFTKIPEALNRHAKALADSAAAARAPSRSAVTAAERPAARAAAPAPSAAPKPAAVSSKPSLAPAKPILGLNTPKPAADVKLTPNVPGPAKHGLAPSGASVYGRNDFGKY